MIIKKVSINNFRSYYGNNEFEFKDGLTLIIGDNGDGKTTFSSNPQPIGFRGNLLVKRQKFILLYIFLAQQKCRRHKIPLPHKAT